MALLSPEFLQTGSYNAMRDRIARSHGGALQSGVWGDNDFKVAQRAAGANMSVDVALGFAWVRTVSPNKGLFHIENSATVNVAVTNAHATLPRIDQVILTVNDSTHGGGTGSTPTLTVMAGVPTSGAQISSVTGANYRAGAPPFGGNAIRLADIFVGPGVSSITSSDINDRRAWARGAFALRTNTSSSSTSGTHTTLQAIPNLGATLELSSSPIVATVTLPEPSVSPGHRAQMFLDSTAFGPIMVANTANGSLSFTSYHAAPTSGRHVIAPFFSSDGFNSVTTIPAGAQLIVRELPVALSDNS